MSFIMRTQYHFLLLLLGTLQYKNNKRSGF